MSHPKNPICFAMGWTATDRLIISYGGRDIAELIVAGERTFEGVYSLNTGHGQPNACLSITGERRNDAAFIKQALARKLFANGRNLRSGEIREMVDNLDQLTVRIPERV